MMLLYYEKKLSRYRIGCDFLLVIKYSSESYNDICITRCKIDLYLIIYINSLVITHCNNIDYLFFFWNFFGVLGFIKAYLLYNSSRNRAPLYSNICVHLNLFNIELGCEFFWIMYCIKCLGNLLYSLGSKTCLGGEEKVSRFCLASTR